MYTLTLCKHYNANLSLILHRLALFGTYIFIEALQNFISVNAASAIQVNHPLILKTETCVSRPLNNMVYFDPIIHHSAGNCQFAFLTVLLAPDTH